MRPERRNAVKVLAFFDIGGSMDAHVKQAEDLFSAAKSISTFITVFMNMFGKTISAVCER